MVVIVTGIFFLQKWNLKDIKNDQRNLLKLWGEATCEEKQTLTIDSETKARLLRLDCTVLETIMGTTIRTATNKN